MPDLGGNVSLSSSLTLTRCPTFKPNSPLPPPDATDQSDSITATTMTTSVSAKSLVDWDESVQVGAEDLCNGSSIRVFKRIRGGRLGCKKGLINNNNNGRCLDDYVRVWVQKKMDLGVAQSRCFLPFLAGAKKMASKLEYWVFAFGVTDGNKVNMDEACLFCHRFIYSGEGMACSVRNCERVYHLTCVMERLGVSNLRKFKCPQHHVVPATDIEEIFCRLPLPYIDEEFKIDSTWKDLTENKLEPAPYVHIRRNVYLVKKKRDDSDGDVGCTNCTSTCCENCMCRVQCISCSRACRCPETCTNRPFRKDKKTKIVKTEFCGWGVEAAEPICKGDFIIEYIGEVIDDKLCEQRLWDMKYKGVQNFYMCEIRKDFTIDATFKGNSSRFLNHSCKPNCILEKWEVEGETRVGVFAAHSIRVGEPLTYDYSGQGTGLSKLTIALLYWPFEMVWAKQSGAISSLFLPPGALVPTFGSQNNIGEVLLWGSELSGISWNQKKIAKLNIGWGAKRKRTSTACVASITI
ncbi:unnamed protein product [Dovyalis caffra]|uniref:Histone-lysine N-methyltransferase ASHR3 n=1 Tax=Dovyalis caffra TaxID=77055 RepID=A0AAV1RQ22_9ROSI|nr:unnamed protein product [Dovyalis caffra]